MRRLLPVLLLIALAGCSAFRPGGQAAVATPTPGNSSTPGSATPRPHPSASVLQAIWVLSPLGLNLRAGPDKAQQIIGSVPQGTMLTAVAFNSAEPGWYSVTFQGKSGWVAAKGFTTTHPQKSYASSAAGYYFLYPDQWTYVDKGADVEVDSPGVAPGNPAAASPSSTPAPSTAPGAGGPKILVHEAQTVDALGQLPTLSGHQLTSSQVEVYGITTIEHTYSVTDPVYKIEADVKLTMSGDHAALLTMYTADAKDLETFTDFLQSFGVSLSAPAASPSP